MRLFTAQNLELGERDAVTGQHPVLFRGRSGADLAWLRSDGRGAFTIHAPGGASAVFRDVTGVRYGAQNLALAAVADLANRHRPFFLGWYERARFETERSLQADQKAATEQAQAVASRPTLKEGRLSSDPGARTETSLPARLQALAGTLRRGDQSTACAYERSCLTGANVVLLVPDYGVLAALAVAWPDGLERLLSRFPEPHLTDMSMAAARADKAWWGKPVSSWLDRAKGRYVWLETPVGKLWTDANALLERANSSELRLAGPTMWEQAALGSALDAYAGALEPGQQLSILADRADLRKVAAEHVQQPMLLSSVTMLGLLAQKDLEEALTRLEAADEAQGGPDMDEALHHVDVPQAPMPQFVRARLPGAKPVT